MITVRDGLMPAIGAVLVRFIVAVTAVFRGAVSRIFLADADPVFLDAIALNVVQMAVVEVIDVSVVLHGKVPAVGAMGMGMSSEIGHGCCSVEGISPLRFGRGSLCGTVQRGGAFEETVTYLSSLSMASIWRMPRLFDCQ